MIRFGRPRSVDLDVDMDSVIKDGIEIWFDRELEADNIELPITIDVRRFLFVNRLILQNIKIKRTKLPDL